ncbi:hypothetical protein ABZ419_24855 [Streptomyces cinnamoneus]|uniref:hypothetical protein n=1 Tax=Streptomyces cinnamoneus TaxID=53446 RepID=UPI0033C9F4B5
MTKIIVTLAWAAVLVGANKLLSEIDWAQYVAIFLLGGVYALLMSKLSKARAPEATR